MRNMPMCPMMMAQMHNMPMMQEQMTMPMHMQAPMCMHMPMMEQMTMPMAMQEMTYEEDERDEEYFATMHSDACHRMMPYVMKTIEKMEQKGDMLYEERPRREMVERMTEEAYNDMVREMPDMADDMGEERVIIRPRRFARDLIGILLINELLRRRRRRRRRRDDYDYGYDFNNDFYYND